MFSRTHVRVAVAASVALIAGLLPLGAQPAPASAAPGASLVIDARRPPLLGKTFWSLILRMAITVSRHASSRMVTRGVTEATLKRVLNEGRVVGRGNGVTRIRLGSFEARVDSRTGNVITVIRLRVSSGGGGR